MLRFQGLSNDNATCLSNLGRLRPRCHRYLYNHRGVVEDKHSYVSHRNVEDQYGCPTTLWTKKIFFGRFRPSIYRRFRPRTLLDASLESICSMLGQFAIGDALGRFRPNSLG